MSGTERITGPNSLKSVGSWYCLTRFTASERSGKLHLFRDGLRGSLPEVFAVEHTTNYRSRDQYHRRNSRRYMARHAMIRRWEIIVGVGAAFAVLLFIVAHFAPGLMVRFGPPQLRQMIICEWTDNEKLSASQKGELLRLLDKDVGDPNAKQAALAALNAHFKEDEDEFVRHFLYVALTSHNSSECTVALFALHKVAPKHKELATTVFRYHATHYDPKKKEDDLKTVAAIGGLAKLSVIEALSEIEALTNHPSEYVVRAAKAGASRLRTATNSSASAP
jgi:hypothetical protein